ncbi:MAG TPA: hypothetical protein VFG42_14590 [Baekduia sp.]|uniref:hypothetical protein n=1 Tax=Baekduia sp. TaxID=2600305 RepID=UPI002D7849B3|nr:hypothetical protein [Baekduia sp.]HET6508015.1 hypothetical protein [Baekduia sp.]
MSAAQTVRSSALAAAAVAILAVLGAATAAAADPLSGAGTPASPYLIASDADLAMALQAINADTAHAGASTASYKLTADVDHANATWTGIDWFSGTFDGDGHTISNIKYAPDAFVASLPGGTGAAASNLGFFRVLDRATVKNLTLKNVTATSTAANASVAGVSVWSFASTVSGIQLLAPTISSTGGGGGSYVGGLVALAYANEYANAQLFTTDGSASTFTDNLVSGGSLVDANRTGGIVGMATGPTTVAHNSVDTTLSNPLHPVDGTGGQANTFYYVVGGLVGEVGTTYTGAGGAPAAGVAMTGNAIAGTIKGSAAGHRSAGSLNFASATVGYATTAGYVGSSPSPSAGNWSTASNLVSSDFQYINSTGAGLPGADPTPVSPQTLKTESTYAGTATGLTDATTSATYDELGWDFGGGGAVRPWTWTGTASDGAPTLQGGAGLAVARTRIVVPVGSHPSDAALLADAGATTTRGTATIDTGDVTWSAVGSYPATIGADGAYAAPVAVTIVVYTPGTVIVAHPTATFAQTSTAPTEAAVLDALGAMLPPGAAGAPTVDLTGAVPGDQAVRFDQIGRYTVTVGDTDPADGLTPTTATVVIQRAGRTTITLTDSTPILQATATAPDPSVVLRALGAAVVNGDGQPTVDLAGAVAGDDAVDFATPGQYRVTVGDSEAGDHADPVLATLRIVAVSVIEAEPTVYFNVGHPPTAASVVSAAGARIADGSGHAVAGTLSATVPAGCGSAAGSCTATLTATDMYGFDTAPVDVTVQVSAAAVAVARGTATLTATGSAPSQAALVDAFGATVSGSTAGGTPVVDTSAVDWDVPGTYDVTVGDGQAHDAADVVRASLRLVPVPVVSLPAVTVYLPLSAADPLDAATLLANSGATLTDRYGNAIDGTLGADTSGVNGRVAGTYAATITGTDTHGFASAPVTVHVVVYLSGMPAGTVSIVGTVAVGATLTADRTGWVDLAPPAYQWLRNGVPIAGATGATYTVTAADAGQSLSVLVTESPSWYAALAATSAPVAVPALPATDPAPPVVAPVPPAVVPTTPATTATAAPRLSALTYRSGAVRLKVKVARKGTVTIRVTMRSGGKTITLGTRRLAVAKAGTASTTVKLSSSARARIRRGTLRTTVTATFTPSATGAKAASARRALTIRKGAR